MNEQINYKHLFFDNLTILEESLYDIGQEIHEFNNDNDVRWKDYNNVLIAANNQLIRRVQWKEKQIEE